MAEITGSAGGAVRSDQPHASSPPGWLGLFGRLSGSPQLFGRSLRERVCAILAGEGEADDFRSLFLDLRSRSRSQGKPVFREIGDFAAHRELRDQGPTMELVRDVFASQRLYIASMCPDTLSPEIARAGALANLRLSSDRKIADSCAMSRKRAAEAIDRVADAMEHGIYPSERDEFVFNHFGGRVIWRPAFTQAQALGETRDVLRRHDLLRKGEIAALDRQASRLMLHIITFLHGSEIALPDGRTAALKAGFFNRERRLEVKAYLVFNDLEKPVFSPLCIFLTDLQPEGLCESALLESEVHGWDMPLRVSSDGELVTSRP